MIPSAHAHRSIEVLESRIAPAAMTFTVTSLADTNTAGTLRFELAAADAHAGPDKIVFHLPAPPVHGENVITLTAPLASTGDVTITGPGAGKLQINGAGLYQGFVFTKPAGVTDSPVTISGLSIVHTTGAISAQQSLTLKNVVVSGNSSSTVGAGISVNSLATDATVSISGSFIAGNKSTGFAGINILGAAGDLKSVTISKTDVTGNTDTTGKGGGLYAQVSGTGAAISVTSSQFTGNTASYGGGLYLSDLNSAATSKITISSSTVSANESVGNSIPGGGGIMIFKGNATISKSTIDNNSAVFNGGGIMASPGFNSLTITDTSVTGNQTTNTNSSGQGGGGLFIEGADLTTLQDATITGSHFLDNSTVRSGGGLFVTNGINLSVTGSSFVSNRAAGNGGGAYASNNSGANVNVTISGSSFAGNIGNGAINTSGTGAGVFDLISSKVSGTVGTGVNAETTGAVLLKTDTITDNLGGGYAGGVNITSSKLVTITGGSITDNFANRGGGLFLYHTTSSVEGVTISGNAALGDGGGVLVFDSDATLQIAKITANSAASSPDVSNVASAITFV